MRCAWGYGNRQKEEESERLERLLALDPTLPSSVAITSVVSTTGYFFRVRVFCGNCLDLVLAAVGEVTGLPASLCCRPEGNARCVGASPTPPFEFYVLLFLYHFCESCVVWVLLFSYVFL